jgi:hypothetical protein
VVLLSGEAGIGKSRLTASLMERVTGEPHTRLRYFCSPQHTDSAFYPITGQMERAAGFVHDDTPQAKLAKLDALLAPAQTIEKVLHRHVERQRRLIKRAGRYAIIIAESTRKLLGNLFDLQDLSAQGPQGHSQSCEGLGCLATCFNRKPFRGAAREPSDRARRAGRRTRTSASARQEARIAI